MTTRHLTARELVSTVQPMVGSVFPDKPSRYLTSASLKPIALEAHLRMLYGPLSVIAGDSVTSHIQRWAGRLTVLSDSVLTIVAPTGTSSRDTGKYWITSDQWAPATSYENIRNLSASGMMNP